MPPSTVPRAVDAQGWVPADYAAQENRNTSSLMSQLTLQLLAEFGANITDDLPPEKDEFG